MTKSEAIIELKDLKEYCKSTFMKETCEAYAQAINKGIEALESQKTGHWIETDMDIYECSECHIGLALLEKENYCPHCGAKMEGE